MSYHRGVGAMTTEEAIELVESIPAKKVPGPTIPPWFIAAAVILAGGAIFMATRKHPRGDTV